MNILLADDHRVLRTGLTLLLKTQPDCDVVGEASNGEEVLALLEKTATDIVLLDLSMPVMNGLECLEEIRRRQYPVKVLVLTMYSEDQYITEVMERGADGYLCKDTLDAELFKALRTVAKGQKYLGERGACASLAQSSCPRRAEKSHLVDAGKRSPPCPRSWVLVVRYGIAIASFY